MQNPKKIILFDGVCNLCNHFVVFVIKRDKRDVFRFTAIQSETGASLIKKHAIDTSQLDSILLFENETYYYKSTAALKIFKHLKNLYPLLYIGIILPRFFRNWMYDYIAKNRYKWFGKKDQCMIPTPELKEKFI